MKAIAQVCQLRKLDDLRVRWPSPERMEKSTKLLGSNRPSGELILGVFLVMDGARVLWAEYVNTDLQMSITKNTPVMWR